MRNRLNRILGLCGIVFGAHAWAIPAAVDASASDPNEVVSQVIVRYKSPAAGSATPTAQSNRLHALAARSGIPLADVRPLMERTSVYRLMRSMRTSEAQSIVDQLARDPAVEWAVVDRRVFAFQALPVNDKYFPAGAPALTPLSLNSASKPTTPQPGAPPATEPVPSGQWYLRGLEQASSIDATGAWAVPAKGSPSIVGAVLDTGLRFAVPTHPDLTPGSTGRVLNGYNFISDPLISNNAGRGADASDPGDWLEAADAGTEPFKSSNCSPQSKSSWHGSFVASIMGANTNNGEGTTGVDQQGKILPVRVLGRCGGTTSDIIDAMRWSVGLPVAGVPANPTPARVVNLSLGGKGACSAAEQAAVDDVRGRGAVVVAAAGNATSTAPDSYAVASPANCVGVIAVAGLRHEGDKVGYSSFGPEVKISAPAGNCPPNPAGVPCLFGMIGASDTGMTSPQAPAYSNEIGTSFSAPLVSGVAMLMFGVHPNLRPDAVLARLQLSARPFPMVPASPGGSPVPVCTSSNSLAGGDGRCNCTASTCGAGMLDARAAVVEAARPQAIITGGAAAAVGQPVALSAATSTVSTAGKSIASYAWTVTSSAKGLTSSGANTPQFTVTSAEPAIITVRLTVVDAVGSSDTTSTAFAVGTPVAAPPAPAASSSGGGGGAVGGAGLVLLAAAFYGARRNRFLRAA